MHPCLQIPEILNRILTSPELTRPESRTTRTLLSVALTCRRFSEPALDVLWADLYDLYPVVACMGVDTQEDEEGFVVFAGPIYPRHLEILKKYTSRVRTYMDNPEIYSSSVIGRDSLSLLYDTVGGPIFPNIREILDADVNDYGDYVKLRLLTGSSLQSISLCVGTDQEEPHELHLASYLANLNSKRYPLLKSLYIRDGLDDITISALSHALQFLPSLNHLHLYLHGLPFETIQIISKMQHLKNLACEFSHDNGSATGPLEDATFPSLETLFISSPAPSCIRTLDLISPSNLIKSIGIKTTRWPITAGQWESFLGFMSQRLHPKVLKEITIEDNTVHIPLRNGPALSLNFNPFTKFANLTTFSCCAVQEFDLTDDLLDQLAQAWPSIMKITFATRTRALPSPRNTLAGLATFAEHCQELRSLTLAFDTSEALLSRAKSQRRYGGKLHTLDVQGSAISNPRRVAAFLSDIFPGITSVDTGRHYSKNEELEVKWAQVAEDIPIFAAVRLDERNRHL